MFKTAMIVFPLVAAGIAATIRHRIAVRLVALAVIVLSFGLGLGGLIAPHRLAEETSQHQRTSDWEQGARDTRDVVYTFIPILASSFAAAVVLAIRPLRHSSKG
jgi:hypothetical protein